MMAKLTKSSLLECIEAGMIMSDAARALGKSPGAITVAARQYGLTDAFWENKEKRKPNVEQSEMYARLAADLQVAKDAALRGHIRAEVARILGVRKSVVAQRYNRIPNLNALFNLNKKLRREWGEEATIILTPWQMEREWVKSFWARVAKGSPNECWEWTGGAGKNRYGQVKLPDFAQKLTGVHALCTGAHRVALAMHLGDSFKPELSVDHLCHNRLCCNPAHMRQCTREQNVARRWHHVMDERPVNMPPLKPLSEYQRRGRKPKYLENFI